MKEQKYCQIISTLEAAQIQPDGGHQNGCYNNIMIECRICLEEHGPFIIPCKCQGTMMNVHENCLKKWAAQKIKRQVQKDEQNAKGKLSNIHGIECELCKQTISMEVRKKKRLVGCSEAKEGSEQYFLPFIPLVIFNASIFLGCLGGAIYMIAFLLMLVFFRDQIYYERYSEDLLMICGILALGLIFCVVFIIKSVIELYHIFVREQHEIIKVIPNPIAIATLVKVTQVDCQNTQWFNTLETLATPTSPHSMSDNLLQTKLSLTKKKISIKRQTAREMVQNKLAKLKEFKANDSKQIKPTGQKIDPAENSVSTLAPKQSFNLNALN